jgi:hypothetical protein
MRQYHDNSLPELVRFLNARLRQHIAVYKVAEVTGGWTEYIEKPEEAAAVYDRIFYSLNRRYVISYYPTNTAQDGAIRQVQIKLPNHPGHRVWGRTAYFAPGPPR